MDHYVRTDDRRSLECEHERWRRKRRFYRSLLFIMLILFGYWNNRDDDDDGTQTKENENFHNRGWNSPPSSFCPLLRSFLPAATSPTQKAATRNLLRSVRHISFMSGAYRPRTGPMFGGNREDLGQSNKRELKQRNGPSYFGTTGKRTSSQSFDGAVYAKGNVRYVPRGFPVSPTFPSATASRPTSTPDGLGVETEVTTMSAIRNHYRRPDNINRETSSDSQGDYTNTAKGVDKAENVIPRSRNFHSVSPHVRELQVPQKGNAAMEGTTEVAGFVGRITYSSKDDFKVIKVRTVGGKRTQQVTLVGNMPGIGVGQTLVFRGYWGNHPRHGKRFTVISWEERAPDSASDMVIYLQGMIKGVGPVTAKNIVSEFGDDTIKILDGPDASLMLEKVSGIGKKTAGRIKGSWDQGRDSRGALQFLQTLGMSIRVAQRVVLRYGANTERIIRSDPYTALLEVRGGGFMEAERIAQTLESPSELPSRYMAGVQHILSCASNQDGHSYLPLNRLISGTMWLLSSSSGNQNDPKHLEQRVRDAINSLHNNGNLMLRHHGSSHVLHPRENINELLERPGREIGNSGSLIRCQSKEMCEAELVVKSNLLSRAQREPLAIDQDRLDSWLERYQTQMDINLNNEQIAAIRMITTSSVSILTGGPGCGKTVTAQALVALWSAQGKKVKLCAPTGRAAQRLSELTHAEAQTVHRLLEFEQKSEGASIDELEIGESNGRFTRNRNNPIEADVVLLDECSMLDLPLAAALFDAIPSDSQVVLVGDMDQLPPVGPGAVFADAIKSGIFNSTKLHQIYRQANQSRIISSAHNVNEGTVPELERIEGKELLEQSTTRSSKHFTNIVSQIRTDCLWVDIQEKQISDAVQVVINKLLPNMGFNRTRDLQVLAPVRMGQAGTVSLNHNLQQLLNPPARNKAEIQRGQATFRVGDRVIQTENNYDSQVFNGDMGYITAIDTKEKIITVRFPLARIQNGRTNNCTGTMNARKLSIKHHDVIYHGVNLRELEPAWAITVHKAQGSEYSVVIIPVAFSHRPLLNRRLLYTALSRAKSMAILIGPKPAIETGVSEIGEIRLTDLDQQWRGSFSEFKEPYESQLIEEREEQAKMSISDPEDVLAET